MVLMISLQKECQNEARHLTPIFVYVIHNTKNCLIKKNGICNSLVYLYFMPTTPWFNIMYFVNNILQFQSKIILINK